MSYMHIDNLYKAQDILLFKECYALEKIHGTSAHISFEYGQLSFFAGGSNHADFLRLFNPEELASKFHEIMVSALPVTVYGEAYGGKLQGMRATYGDKLRFVCFEVKIGESWLNVPAAEAFVKSLGLEFVSYAKTSTSIYALDEVRALPSAQAKRNGIKEDRVREGIVLRPLVEVRLNNGDRIIAKYKNEEFKETRTERKIVPGQLEMLTQAKDIATEWVTAERMRHILDGQTIPLDTKSTAKVIDLMTADIIRESAGEIVDSKEVRRQIGRETALMFKSIVAGSQPPERADEKRVVTRAPSGTIATGW